MLLTVENHVQARLVELFYGDLVGALCENLHLVDAALLRAFFISPLALSHDRSRDKA